jgi:hypothetical protein
VTTLATFTAALLVTVWPQGADGPSTRHRVVCPGASACAQLRRVGRAAFAAVPSDQVCTEIYGGPARALVTGRLAGRPVWARFSRSDGCQIARWSRLVFLLRA